MVFPDPEHFEKLKSSITGNANDSGGKYARKFADELPGVYALHLPDDRLSRDCVFKLARQDVRDVNTATVCAAILAWGGMHTNHRDLLFHCEDRKWLEVACSLRNGKLDRKEAYARFKELRRHGKMKGMGPAFFTKLIYFLMPQESTALKPGYIMDQWAGCSINLLAGQEIVLMDVHEDREKKGPGLNLKFTVSNENCGTNYVNFCEKMAYVANLLSMDVGEVDRALVSKAGKPWREHVKNCRRVPW
ncbi:MAG: hypothetical protein OXI59_19630 [Gemmatimonadota bacterium]|nr:hypothetical protein [Gemmatimonadota bacterium]